MPAVRVKTATGWQDVAIQGPAGPSSGVAMDSVHYVGGSGEPAFSNSWVNFDNSAAVPGTATQRSARFRKDSQGKVRLSGVIKSGASGTTAFTLPVGYRPPSTQAFVVDASASVPAIVNVLSDGSVQPQNIGTSAVATFVFLDGVEFDTESVTSYSAPAAMALESWHAIGGAGEPAFQNAWANYGGVSPDNYQAAGFRRYPDGKVRLRGTIKSGGIGDGTGGVAFTLPAGYRPVNRLLFAVFAAAGVGRVDVLSSNGEVRVVATPGSANTNVTLDGIEFDTEATTQTMVTPVEPAGQRISASEFTASSGTLASGAESAADVTITHSLGVVPSVVVGHLEDGSWSHQFGWRVNARTTTTVTIRFRNAGPNSGSAILRCRLIY